MATADWTGLVLAEPALERLVQNMSDPADQSVSASQKKKKDMFDRFGSAKSAQI